MSIYLTTLQRPDALGSRPADIHGARWFAALLQADTLRLDASHATLLAWVIGLPPDLDPAEAAAAVLAYQQGHATVTLSAPLIALLQDVAAYQGQRLARLKRGRRIASASRQQVSHAH